VLRETPAWPDAFSGALERVMPVVVSVNTTAPVMTAPLLAVTDTLKPACCPYVEKLGAEVNVVTLASVAGAMVAESPALAIGEPPPDTVTEFVTVDGASMAILAVRVIGGYLTPAVSVSLREQVLLEQFQPGPNMEN
jgi:hypothetical protein